MSPTARIRFGVEHNADEVERNFSTLPPALTRATREGARRAGRLLIQSLEAQDGTSARWQQDMGSVGDRTWFTARSTEDSQAYREFGTKPHRIVARPGKVLSFYWNRIQRRVFFKEVNHPGYNARPYVARAGMMAERGMVAEIERAWEEALERGFN